MADTIKHCFAAVPTISMLLLISLHGQCGVYADITRLDVPEYIHHEDSALMTCVYDADIAQLSWKFSDPGENVGNAEELLVYRQSTTSWSGPALGRMTGAIIGMSSTLTIHSVDWQMDNGTFWCVTIDALDYDDSILGDNTTVSVSPSVLSVYDNSGNFRNSSTASVVVGTNHIFTCRAEGCNPPATLKWVIGDTIANPKQTNEENIVAGLWDTTSSYNLIPDINQHNEQLKCIASVPAETSSQISLVVIYVKVPPNDNTVKLSDDANTGGFVNDAVVRVDENQQHTFTCSVEDTRPSANITWMVDNSIPGNDFTIVLPVAPTPTDQLVDASSTISFNPSRDYHRSTTDCIANINLIGTDVKRNIIIDVYGSPDIPVITNNAKMIEGISRLLSCNANNAYPEGNIAWLINDENITDVAATNTLMSDNRYDITSTHNYDPRREHNNNKLKCRATHQSGDVEKTEILDVQFCASSATLTLCPSTSTVNDAVTVRCSTSTGYPSSDIDWYKNQIEMESKHTPELTPGDFDGQITVLDYTTGQLTKEDNNARLHCCAVNKGITCDAPVCSSDCVLNVQYPADILTALVDPSSPVEEGNDVTLQCSADGNPQPDSYVYWEKQGSSEDLNDEYNDGTSELRLTGITRDKAGYYECVADNGVGSADRSMPLAVAVYYSANISNKHDNYRGVDEGKDAILDCIADGLPNPVFKWYHHNGTILTNNTDRVHIIDVIQKEDDVGGTVIQSRLHISTVPRSDHGLYTCEVDNGIGTPDSFTINLNGTTKPSPVLLVTATASTLNNISIQWEAGYDGGKEQWFVIDYRKNIPNEQFGQKQTANDTTDQFTIVNLIEDTEYEIRVRSENVNGRNENGLSAIETTKKLPDPPKSVEIVRKSTVSLTVQWTPANAGRNPSQWFLIDYRKPNGEFTGDRGMVKDGSNTFEVKGLIADTTYEVAVYSADENGVNEEYVSDTDDTEPIDSGQNGSQTGIIVGGTIGAVCLLILIMVLLVYLFRHPVGKNRNAEIALNDGFNGRSGLSNTAEFNTVDENGGDTSAPEYAAVNKKNKKSAADTSAPEYAAVNKKNKKTSAGASAEDSTYANVNFKTGDEDVYDDVANVNPVLNEENTDNGRTVNAEGLIYQEVGHFKSHPKDAPPIQTDASTEYAALDFNRLKPGSK